MGFVFASSVPTACCPCLPPVSVPYSAGVRFSACQNTGDGMTKMLGYRPKLSKDAVEVSAGIVRIVDLYTYARP